MYNFDEIIARDSTYAFKWERYKGKDIIPSWVADTEFRCAPAIIDAMRERTEHGLFGYTFPNEYTPAINAVKTWCLSQYDWKIEPEWVVWTPGVVPAFNMAINAFTKEGEGVIVQTPNYPPLLAAPSINKRRRYEVKNVLVDGRWTLDLEALESFARQEDTKLFILCNPMNPVGSVLTEDELERISEICIRHNVKLCSDEIHCDLILDGSKHIPVGKIDKIADQSVTLMAASKTFNIAGLGTSFAIIPDANLRKRFVSIGAGIMPWVNVMGLVATEVAFTKCDEWHLALLNYLKSNRDYLSEQINQIDGLHCVKPQATFLLWVDASGLGVSDTQLWCEERGVGPSPGRDFGQPDCFRLNFGCPRYMLEMIVKGLQN